jgi:hypothetical protein
MNTERSFRFSFLTTLVAVALATTTANADLIGHYKVAGTAPDGAPYSGEATVELVGNIFHVVREISGQRYIGTGIGRQNILAVTYHSGTTTVLALYSQDETGRWTGTWTSVDAGQIGTERWLPHASHLPSRSMPR